MGLGPLGCSHVLRDTLVLGVGGYGDTLVAVRECHGPGLGIPWGQLRPRGGSPWAPSDTPWLQVEDVGGQCSHGPVGGGCRRDPPGTPRLWVEATTGSF